MFLLKKRVRYKTFSFSFLKATLGKYECMDSHPWKLENYFLSPSGFFYFRFPRWKFIYDVSLGAATPAAASPIGATSGVSFEVASTRLACGGVKRKVDATELGDEFHFRDLDTR